MGAPSAGVFCLYPRLALNVGGIAHFDHFPIIITISIIINNKVEPFYILISELTTVERLWITETVLKFLLKNLLISSYIVIVFYM